MGPVQLRQVGCPLSRRLAQPGARKGRGGVAAASSAQTPQGSRRRCRTGGISHRCRTATRQRSHNPPSAPPSARISGWLRPKPARAGALSRWPAQAGACKGRGAVALAGSGRRLQGPGRCRGGWLRPEPARGGAVSRDRPNRKGPVGPVGHPPAIPGSPHPVSAKAGEVPWGCDPVPAQAGAGGRARPNPRGQVGPGGHPYGQPRGVATRCPAKGRVGWLGRRARVSALTARRTASHRLAAGAG